MRIAVNRDLCDGNGLCVKEAPKHLAIDAQDVLHVLKEEVEPDELAQVQRAVKVCPKAALSLVE